jgi:hypothetical protein
MVYFPDSKYLISYYEIKEREEEKDLKNISDKYKWCFEGERNSDNEIEEEPKFVSRFYKHGKLRKFTVSLFKNLRTVLRLIQYKDIGNVVIKLNEGYKITLINWGSVPYLQIHNLVSGEKLMSYHLGGDYWSYNSYNNSVKIDLKTFVKELNCMISDEDYAAISLQVDHWLIELV